MDRIIFHKFQGTGNDFIIVDERQHISGLGHDEIARLCHRRFGIGADGLIIIQPDAELDFRMIYYNSDGREGTMCGNGGRCAIAYFVMTGGKNQVSFRASDGIHTGRASADGTGSWDCIISLNDIREYRQTDDDTYFLNTGSPHHITFHDDVGSLDVSKLGSAIRHSEFYQPEGTNVNFVQSGIDGIFCRTFERGVEDETLSCGTGVTAAAIATHLRDRKPSPMSVHTPGGILEVSFKREGDSFIDIRLHGQATIVFTGEIIR